MTGRKIVNKKNKIVLLRINHSKGNEKRKKRACKCILKVYSRVFFLYLRVLNVTYNSEDCQILSIYCSRSKRIALNIFIYEKNNSYEYLVIQPEIPISHKS